MTPKDEKPTSSVNLPNWAIWGLGILVVAVSTIWAITWGVTANSVNGQELRLRNTEVKLDVTCEKVNGITESLTEIKSDLKEIKKSVSQGRTR